MILVMIVLFNTWVNKELRFNKLYLILLYLNFLISISAIWGIVPYNFCKDGIRIEKSFCLGGINNVDISCVMAVVD